MHIFSFKKFQRTIVRVPCTKYNANFFSIQKNFLFVNFHILRKSFCVTSLIDKLCHTMNKKLFCNPILKFYMLVCLFGIYWSLNGYSIRRSFLSRIPLSFARLDIYHESLLFIWCSVFIWVSFIRITFDLIINSS